VRQGIAKREELLAENQRILDHALREVDAALGVSVGQASGRDHPEAHRLKGVILYQQGLAKRPIYMLASDEDYTWTGEDLTRSVLTQIIYENETKGEGALPLNFLRQLIGFYGGGAQSMLPAWLDMSMNQFAEAQERWRTAMGGATPMALLEKQTKRNMAMFENAMKMFNPAMAATDTKLDDGDVPEMHEDDETPSDRALKLMQAQMAEMQKQLEALSGKK